MSISIADNFSYQGSKPLDARVKFDTIAAMVAVPAANLYDGIEAYVAETGKYYSYDSANTVDSTLGKWRKRSGGHEIEDSTGTAVTEREKMQFSDSFSVSDDSTDALTQIELNKLTSGEMGDVVTPLPTVRTRYRSYSTGEQKIGKWLDGKDLFERTFIFTIPTYEEGTSDPRGELYREDTGIASSEVDTYLIAEVYYLVRNGSPEYLNLSYSGTHDVVLDNDGKFNTLCRTWSVIVDGVLKISIRNQSSILSGKEAVVVMRYTKS